MTPERAASRLTTYVAGAHLYRHRRPLTTEIAHRAHQAGLHGATVLHSIEGFGRHATIHTSPVLTLVDHTPSAVIIVAAPERIHTFLLDIDDSAADCFIVRDEVEITR
jgi:PII-like signaling protein